MTTRWMLIGLIWASTLIGAVFVMEVLPKEHALEWFGALLAGSVAVVSLVHLIKARPAGFIQELIYAGGGSYLILAIASVYLFLRG